MALAPSAAAAEISAVVRDGQGQALADAVIVAAPLEGVPRLALPKERQVVDQIDKEFVPRVKPILVGSQVSFPNHDNIRHEVYSFSPAKTFELPLYAGTPAKPVLFDKPGVVVLGCNIHDWMVGYIYVSESPWFAKTAADGKAVLRGLPPGRYAVRAWHPRLDGDERATEQQADLRAGLNSELSWTLKLHRELAIRRVPGAGIHSHY